MTNFSKFILKEKFFNSSKYNLNMPYIIAEIGVNHEGSLDRAKEMIINAKKGGAHAVKFQSYKAEKLASKNSPAYWDTTKEKTLSQYELFKKHDKFGENEFKILYEFCKVNNIDFSSTPFDLESANYLNKYCEFFKISSSDLTNHPFIKHICEFKKPIILSTGASTLDEIDESVKIIQNHANKLILLHCVLNYPTENHNANLGVIKLLKDRYKDVIIGYSDHTLPGSSMKTCEIAHLLGAEVIEKHFTFDKTLNGNDHYHAMDYNDLKIFTKKLKENAIIYGETRINLESQQSAIKNARRSLYYANNLNPGDVIKLSDIDIKRPGIGIEPKKIDEVIGRKLIIEVEEDQVIKMDHFR